MAHCICKAEFADFRRSSNAIHDAVCVFDHDDAIAAADVLA
jgi:hypothetical protein